MKTVEPARLMRGARVAGGAVAVIRASYAREIPSSD
jgi:hypothetical protein